jgi:isopentenyldiphosphate isomerase
MPPTSFNLPNHWAALRQTAAAAGRILDLALFEQTWQLYLDLYAAEHSQPADLTREYGREEYLQVVGADGEVCGVGAELIKHFQFAQVAHSQFGRWFQVGVLRPEETGEANGADEQPGEPVLLAARWLCHLIGLRHRTVEIFLDPPGVEEGYTLVQVRGMDKVEAPGAFDIPCAGHASGCETAVEALCHELSEELNLTPENLDGLHLVARYISPARSSNETLLLNEEYRFLYRAVIKPGAVSQIHFRDGEVGGLALFNWTELCALAQRFPERIASGLGDSLQYYKII